MNNMLLYLGLVFVVTLTGIAIFIRLAPALGFIDVPSTRSMHQSAMPVGAGIPVMLAVALAYPLFFPGLFTTYIYSLLAIFLVFVIGILDDHRDTRPKTKFLVIAVATILLFMNGLEFHSFQQFFGIEITLGMLTLPFMLFATIGFTNAFNLIDGLDGLSGSLAIVIFGTFASIGYMHQDLFILSISAGFLSALTAFLLFNWHPARIFLGDSGSLAIGFIIAILSMYSVRHIPPVAILFIAALPIFDTLAVMIRRKRTGKSMFKADKTHIHHITLTFFQGKVRRSVLFLTGIQLLYAFVGLNMQPTSEQAYYLIIFFISLVIIYVATNALLGAQNRNA